MEGEMNPELMTPDQLIQRLEEEVIELSTSFDLIDSARDDRVSRELNSIKSEIARRMGIERESRGISLIDELIAVIITKTDDCISDKARVEERYQRIKTEILQIMAENFTVVQNS